MRKITGFAVALCLALGPLAARAQQADDSFSAGHLTPVAPQNVANNGQPVLSTCGTSPTLNTYATDLAGTITFGAGAVTACTITFAQPYATPPTCGAWGTTSGFAPSAASVTARSATAVTITAAASLTSGTLDYMCMGR